MVSLNRLPPTDEHIEKLVSGAGLKYTKGKTGKKRFYDASGSVVVYPSNNSAIGQKGILN
ncbi:hypothetical protein HNR45_000049 [Negativicoccus succinicivorans]|uniref:Uncharacterized protein n=1 Tax=Negativicoccus succinicivorans TaxID=620903 RepID=A0A841R1N3_9FIRM|nr:hypothetical protein [Negativicoccus succinicivorans]MBB6477027.1 hypothetical protein [Negativicoccus succinicivorans]